MKSDGNALQFCNNGGIWLHFVATLLCVVLAWVIGGLIDYYQT